MKVFISYSHKDETALERLHTHLAVLRREGRIDEWFDREILPGGEIDADVTEQLESSGMFLLLLSPDFLASDYCVEREMQRALERHRLGDARVVPIIVEPCDWESTPLRNLKALPRDGKPVSDWTNENNAYLDVVRELRRVLETGEVPPAAEHGEATERAVPSQSGVRRYRVKRDFDEIDRSDFREEAFGVIRDYFELAVAEIDAIEDLRGRFISLSAVSFTCMIVNRARDHGTANITVHGRSENLGFGDISYSFSENASPNTANGMFMIEADEYELYLSSMMGFGGHQERLTPEAAAEQLWEDFLQQAGVTSD
ncbi:MAG: toll/interleukin-1 receptor domain-containing protein [Candidatus Tectomicrobia bacterium]|nr:toll/interleukin-1 receptor domain-containing protein [Candidatus Tectomicrobia bacterium]